MTQSTKSYYFPEISILIFLNYYFNGLKNIYAGNIF